MKKHMPILRLILSLATAGVLVLLAWQCIDIYLEGSSPANLDASGVHLHPIYSAEIVQGHLEPIRPILVTYIGMTLGALLAQSFCPEPQSVCPIASADRLRLMKARVGELPEEAMALERQRRGVHLSAGAVGLICAIFSLTYLLNREHFTSWDLEMVMGQMLLHVVPWIAVGFAAGLLAAFACERSRNQEIALLKGSPGKLRDEMETTVRHRSAVGIVRAGLYAAAIVFILLGVMNGGMRDVLVKATNICTECIGLG